MLNFSERASACENVKRYLQNFRNIRKPANSTSGANYSIPLVQVCLHFVLR